ncbi:PREDICTED: uncharacterized protein LOC109242076 [Nicotiana attenuata]|uniref:uncharacterized protein LOC109242076 n=1 Tax=Nicotiana attenuata TaxID=49451 RepID=UPI00090496D3|nr:PREDICTED: uncharacterized protein LOC109242076 [Nicotiana attenuata]
MNRYISGVWHKEVPFKISFLTWRVIQDKLSTEDRVAGFGIEIDPICHCCNNNNQNLITENVDHLFCLGEHAKKIWRFFAGPLGIDYNNMNLKMLLLKWWNFKARNCIAKLITRILPLIICWELWKSRCSKKFENIRLSFYRTKTNILFTLVQILNSSFGRARLGEDWQTIYVACEAVIERRILKIIKWNKPSFRAVKLNSDGSCIQGTCGGGGLVRNNQGIVIFAYFIPLGPGTSNFAEATSMLFGIKWCAANGYRLVLGETDSMLITRCIRREQKVPWRIKSIITEIQDIVEEHGFVIIHCFREANRPADKLASLSHSSDMIHVFNSFADLPNQVKGLVNMDRWDLPSFRIKTAKPGHITSNPP